MRLNDGVSYYTEATLKIFFPEDKVTCQWCPLCRGEDSLKRNKCALTGEYLVYPFTFRGNQCPLEIIEIKEEKEKL